MAHKTGEKPANRKKVAPKNDAKHNKPGIKAAKRPAGGTKKAPKTTGQHQGAPQGQARKGAGSKPLPATS